MADRRRRGRGDGAGVAEVRIRPAPWADDAAALLAGHETPAVLRWFRKEVEAGEAQLLRIEDEAGALLCAVIVRIDDDPDGPEGVIVSAAGRAGFDLTAECLGAIEARFQGVAGFRIHTKRPGLARKLQRQGYGAAELVLRKRVKHGQ